MQRVLVDANNTTHVFFTRVPGLGALQLYHCHKVEGGAWSAPALVSTPGANSFGVVFGNVLLDRAGLLHCFFGQLTASALVLQIWHTSLAIDNPGGGWTVPVNVSRSSQPAQVTRVVTDRAGTLHLLFETIPNVGTLQQYHAYLLPGQGWSAPTLVTLGGSFGVDAFSTALLEDGRGRLHLLFAQVGGTSTVRQVWYRVLQVSNPAGGWSPPVNISQASQPAVLRSQVVDSSGTIHVLFQAIPTTGVLQVHHTHAVLNGGWSTPRIVSTAGPSSADDVFFRAGPDGRIHLAFVQLEPTASAYQLWHSTLSVANPAGAWSTPVNVTRGTLVSWGSLRSKIEFLFDSKGTLHALFEGAPSIAGVFQVFHAYLPAAGAWSTPVVVSTPGSPTFRGFLGRPFEDLGDRLHVTFEQDGSGGLLQIWNRSIRIDALASGWSTPINVSRSNLIASAHQTFLDSGNTLHVYYLQIPSLGIEQVYHVALPESGVPTTPVVVSTAGSPTYIPILNAFGEDRLGRTYCLINQIGGAALTLQAWFTSTDTHQTLTANRTTLPVAFGGTQVFGLRAGPAHGGRLYLVAGTASGTSTGVRLMPKNNRRIPLNEDGYFGLTLSSANRGLFSQTLGMLSPAGTASAALTLPALPPAMKGMVLQHAYLLVTPTLNLDMVSNVVSLRLQ